MTYDVGDTVRLKLTVDPDETPTLTVTAPSGTVTTPIVTLASPPPEGLPVTAGVYEALVPLTEAGVWAWRWVTPNGAEPGELLVGGAITDVAWRPTLRQVAAHVPERTRPENAPERLLLTFNAHTQPTDREVGDLIASAVAYVAGSVPSVHLSLYPVATAAAALRAAAFVELAYPRRDADVNVAEQLLAQADALLTQFVAANSSLTPLPPVPGAGGVALVPIASGGYYWGG